MKSEKYIQSCLVRVEKEMHDQVAIGMDKGWPVFGWDKNCVERHLLRKILGLKYKPFCAADCMAGW